MLFIHRFGGYIAQGEAAETGNFGNDAVQGEVAEDVVDGATVNYNIPSPPLI